MTTTGPKARIPLLCTVSWRQAQVPILARRDNNFWWRPQHPDGACTRDYDPVQQRRQSVVSDRELGNLIQVQGISCLL